MIYKKRESLKETDFVYASAYTRTLENKMLIKSDYEALLNSASVEEALNILSAKGYANNKSGQTTDVRALLKEEMAYIWEEVTAACPADAPLYILLYQNDFHNLKTILKSIFSHTAYESLMMEPYTVSPDFIYNSITEGKIESLPEFIKNSAAKAYLILARDNDGQLAEIMLDKAFYTAMSEAAKSLKNSFLADWVDLNIAVMNMKAAFRGAYSGKSKEYIRGAMLDCRLIDADELAAAAELGTSAVLTTFWQTGFGAAADAAADSVSVLEKWCDNELIKFLRQTKYKLYGFETVFSFITGKQFELQAVRIILSGIQSGVAANVLRERLRDLYV